MFVVFAEDIDSIQIQYHYVFLNESSTDRLYGFTEIKEVSLDQMIVEPHKVFSKVEALRTLDTVSIAMTDYGFWDIE
jgi:hypothetical protein